MSSGIENSGLDPGASGGARHGGAARGGAFDVLVIGSGIGGLVCAGVLAREGLRVCVLEKNPQIGGALQTYTRDKVLFDAGVHYMGGLAPGQNLYQIFKYLGIMDELHLTRLDEDAFDTILIGDDPTEYAFAQGYDRFVDTLAARFPAERAGILAYADAIRDVCSRFPLYNLRAGGVYSEKAGVLETDARTTIEGFTKNEKLREVLAGNNILYAGQPGKTPFYVHALVLNSFIESSWKCTDGGGQLAKVLARSIRSHGGDVRTRAEVTQIVEENGRVTHLVLADGSKVYANAIVSSLHPAQTLALTPSALLKPAYRGRIGSLENSIASFCVNLVLQPRTVRYEKHNYYYMRPGCAWTQTGYTGADWPRGYALFYGRSRTDPSYASSVTIMSYMRYDEVAPWAGTFNTVAHAEARAGEGGAHAEARGADYEAFKRRKYGQLMRCVAERFPELAAEVAHWYASTPLSFRDYLGTADGSLYGIVKDYRNPVKTIIPARTKVEGLFLTGQNLNLHGILGAAISSLATCADLLGRDDFVEKIKNA
ncbi:MAG TPA: NAD(P)/FAD-dependent oxidoreductase [Dinghuibacter sp.]|uniref:phytoene desaturase family protein n=1 Tax=Dinghuibacter sp. TaxID=2024697 RepID=UPI002C5C2DC5|nr:NAD(P)/FAD-dependent oxidoreductase [Dinghuibacter sp.]HTJ11435.1 NAD(P)/FAD-dependent oxidoreductase [Dinghuibacter sp.]